MFVYLHIGTHKTGTTAIQTTFVANRERLADHGILYPSAGRPLMRTDVAYGHHALAWSLTRPESTPDCWPEMRRELDASGCEAAVVSSECLDMITEEEHFAHIRSHLDGYDVRVVAYLRRQDELLHAGYCTNVLHYGETREFSEYLRDPPTEPDYRRLLGRWERAFGREALIVRPYERSQLESGDVVGDFANRIGLSLPDGFITRGANGANPSFPRSAIESARALRLAGANRKALNPVRELCELVYASSDSDADLLSPADRRALLDEYAESNAFVARTYLDRADGRLFNDLDVGDPDRWRERYAGELADLATSIRDLRDAFRARRREPAQATDEMVAAGSVASAAD